MKPAVHQFHSGSAMGDGVTNGMFYVQRLLRQAGFTSDIFVQHRDPHLGDAVLPHTALVPDPDNVLLVHHSMGHDLSSWVLSRPERMFLVYHNITPPEMLPPAHRPYAVLGRKQIQQFRPRMAGAIAVSPYNAVDLRAAGYETPEVLELLVDLDALRQRPVLLPKDYPQGRNTVRVPRSIVCIGRVCPHKCQHDVIEIARHMAALSSEPFHIRLIGGYDADSSYITMLHDTIARHGLAHCVSLTGKVSDEELYGWYKSADVLISMSEHEGFCMPLVEAMAFDVPIIAYETGNVPHTLGQAGLLVREKQHRELAALTLQVIRDKALRRQLVAAGRRQLAALEPAVHQQRLTSYLAAYGVTPPILPATAAQAAPVRPQPVPVWQMEGPCETSYSLALVNRELAFALDRAAPGQVGVLPMEGVGEYAVDQAAVDGIPGLRDLINRGTATGKPDVVLRNLYPPRVHDTRGRVNILQLAWEESRISPDWVASFNASLDAIATPTQFVRKVLIDAGVTLPIRVSGHGVEHILSVPAIPYPDPLGKGFKFLHISSCFPRKGIDVLLAAYGKAFQSSDDVTLVIKTFPNPHNTIEDQIAALRVRLGPQCPDIVLINQDLPPSQIKDLYQRCDALVAPSRGEGFGLPMAEAMALGLPVITTGHGAQLDFCTPETSWLVHYRLVPTTSHHSQPYSVWAEPDAGHLASVMREVFTMPPDSRRARAERARTKVLAKLRWDRCAKVLRGMVDELSAHSLEQTTLRLGWVSTYNSRCGIATYSDFLVKALDGDRIDLTVLANHEPPVGPDPDHVVRCWFNRDRPDLSGLLAEIDRRQLDAVVIQFNYAFYDLAALGGLIKALKTRGVVVTVMFHATGDVMEKGEVRFSLRQILPTLELCDRLLVHSLPDLERLRTMGLVDNAMLFPHGAIHRPFTPVREARRRLHLDGYDTIIGMYGFLLPNKGVLETIEAMPKILERRPNSLLLLVNALYPNPVSDKVLEKCAARIEELKLQDKVVMVTSFLEHDESLLLLEAADVVVFPYQHSNESASGAVKVGMAANRPVLCSPLNIFNDLDKVVGFLPGTAPTAIADGILTLLSDPGGAQTILQQQTQWLAAHDWNELGVWLGNLLRSLWINAPALQAMEARSEEAEAVEA